MGTAYVLSLSAYLQPTLGWEFDAALSKSFSPLDVIIRIRSGRKQDGAGAKQQPDLETAHPVSTVTSTAINFSFLDVVKEVVTDMFQHQTTQTCVPQFL